MRIEAIANSFKESARHGRMNSHPHNVNCDGKGDIELLKVDKNTNRHPIEPAVLGAITKCTSCGYIKKTGTLFDADYEPGQGYYF